MVGGISVSPRALALAVTGIGLTVGSALLVHSLRDSDSGQSATHSTIPPASLPSLTSPDAQPLADAQSGASVIDDNPIAAPTTTAPTTTAPAVAAAPIITTPGPQLLSLTKAAPHAATKASDPASFMQLLRADGPGWAASDGTISVPLADGKTLWLFGDTLMNLPNADGSLRRNADFVRNSAILQDGQDVTTLTTGNTTDADDFLKPSDPNEWYWPGHGIVEGDELILFMGRVGKTTTGAPGWNFEGRGSDMVRLNLKDLSVKGRISMPGGHGWDWGTAVLDDKGYTYVYGFRGYDNDPFRREAVVARAKSGELKDGAFEYWNGTTWTPDAASAAPVATGLSNSFSVIKTPNGRYAMVSQEIFFETKLKVRTADSPQGPWSEWRVVDDGPTKPENQISYNAQAHPSFTADGKMLVSWNMNLSNGKLPRPDQLDAYRPVFRAVDVAAVEG